MYIRSSLILAVICTLNAPAVGQTLLNQIAKPSPGAPRAVPPPNRGASLRPPRPTSIATVVGADPRLQDESREIVGPVVSYFSSKEVCNIYVYQGGKVADRSVDGEAGVFEVSISAVNMGFPVPSGSPFTSVCGDPGKLVVPSETFSFDVKAQFRKSPRGWHLERVLPQ
jgi:hypothetical protein